MKFNADWAKRRWLDFRNGHSTYLVFAMGFMQFTIITYTLAVERLPLLKDIFPSMSYWIVFFIAVYLPSAVIVGHLHMKKQVPREIQQLAENNPHNFQTAPGKEQQYTLPINRMTLEMRLLEMEMRNNEARIFEEIFKQPFPKYQLQEFERVHYFLEMTKQLQAGAKITDIVRMLKSA